MKTRKYRVGLRAQMQPTYEGFQPFIQQQQQAKTGVVTSVAEGDIANAAAVELEAALVTVAASDPLRTTTGSLVVEALRAVPEAKVVMAKLTNNLANRRVTIFPGDTLDAAYTDANAAANTDAAAVLTFDNGSDNNDSVTNAVADGIGLSAAINAKLATRKPTFSLASLINAIEDVILADTTKDALVFIDQTSHTIKVLTGTPAVMTGAEGGAIGVAEAVNAQYLIDSSPVVAGDKLLGE